LQAAIHIFESWGLKVLLSSHLFDEENQFSASDAQRAFDMQHLLDNKQVNCIISARGGYGSVRIIDKLEFKNFEKYPKWVAGFSDVTVFHSHLNNLNFATLHCTMPVLMKDLSENDFILTQLKNALFGEELNYEFEMHKLNRGQNAEGEIVGGNLSVLYSLLGSKSQLKTDDKILFLEDLDEYLYHIDRMMIALLRAGMLGKLKGLLIGHFSDMKDNAIPFGKSAYEIIFDAVKHFDYPVFFNFKAGHEKENYPIRLGTNAEIFSENNTMKFLQRL
jgi:muramoyltetrapeptide carboxypeptidase